jgi:hypothetical protein
MTGSLQVGGRHQSFRVARLAFVDEGASGMRDTVCIGTQDCWALWRRDAKPCGRRVCVRGSRAWRPPRADVWPAAPGPCPWHRRRPACVQRGRCALPRPLAWAPRHPGVRGCPWPPYFRRWRCTRPLLLPVESTQQTHTHTHTHTRTRPPTHPPPCRGQRGATPRRLRRAAPSAHRRPPPAAPRRPQGARGGRKAGRARRRGGSGGGGQGRAAAAQRGGAARWEGCGGEGAACALLAAL